MSFYRTYRPQIITELDNVRVRETITGLLKKDTEKLPHAFFLYGPKGAGKTTTARIIAKLFNCEKRTKDGPCGVCEQCISIANGTNMDVVEIDAASNRGIDDIRALRERIGLSSVHGGYTVYIIDEVHMLTTEAFNALLKTLEEPPTHAVFVLATTDPEKVPGTVRSRCVTINFSKAAEGDIVAALSRIAKKEKMDIEKDALSAIADASDGAFRDAVKFLEQASFLEGKITKEQIIHMLAKSETKAIEDLYALVFTRKGEEAVASIESYAAHGMDMKTFLVDSLTYLHAILVSQTKGETTKWNIQDVEDCIHRLTKAYGELRISPIPQLPLELAVLEFCAQDKHIPSVLNSIPLKKQEIPNQSKAVPSEKIITDQKEEKSSKDISDFLTLEKLASHWPDFIEALKPYNHSVAGVVRSTKPKSIVGDTVIIEALYPFHKERLSDPKAHDILTTVLKKLFGANVKVEVVLGKK